jgi:hypothetical protein
MTSGNHENRTDAGDDQVATVESVREKIRPILAGLAAEVQGAVLADLLAIWLAGHNPELREDMLVMHLGMVRKLLTVNARDIAQRHGLKDWE